MRIDSPPDALAAKIDSLPASGNLMLEEIPSPRATRFPMPPSPAQLQFVPPANANGTAYSSFTFQLRDSGGTDNGGVDLIVAEHADNQRNAGE